MHIVRKYANLKRVYDVTSHGSVPTAARDVTATSQSRHGAADKELQKLNVKIVSVY